MSGWQLGVDLGTTNTVAAVRRGESVTTVDIESSGSSRMPSSVFLTETGELLVGTAAAHQAVFSPERFEPTPKRAIGEGEIFLGDRLVPVTELIAGILKRVYAENCRQQGESTPDAFVLTHPADWSEARLQVLRDAVQIAGLPTATLVPEPVAAAVRIASGTPAGSVIAVYDFGGGTFDAAVLRRTPTGFEVAGPPAGRDPLGGEDVDARIVTHLGTVLEPSEAEAWASLTAPTDIAWRRHATALRAEVQRAKETLSEVSACQLWIPGLEREVQLTRPELEELIAPEIEATIDTLEVALADAGVAAKDLAGVYLVGGSSRIPLVADLLWRRLGVRPSVQDNPKAVVALGAASWNPQQQVSVPVSQAAPPRPAGPALSSAMSGGAFRPLVAADIHPSSWPAGCTGAAQLVLDVVSDVPSTVRARDEPAQAGVAEIAARAGRMRSERTPGYRELGVSSVPLFGVDAVERRFVMSGPKGPLSMVERYAVVDGRAVVVAFPESSGAVADALALVAPPGQGVYASRFSVPVPRGWSATESLRVARAGSPHALLLEHGRPAGPTDGDGWRSSQLGALRPRLGKDAALAGRSSGMVLDRLAGTIDTVRWRNRGQPMLTKLGTAVIGVDTVAVTITLPHVEQNLFASLARQALVHPAAAQAA